MAETNHKPSLALDFVIVSLAVALVVLSLKFGLRVGHPATKGPGAVLGGIYFLYLGLLFLLSYLFPQACYVFSFMRYVSEEWSRPRSRHTALFYSGLLLVVGAGLLLVGLGAF
jgi:hypothetical protein